MTNTMTPSEIADWLEDEASRFPADNEWHSFHRQQAATIRAQAEALKIATEALEPFARAAGKLDGHWIRDDCRWNNSVTTNVTVGDLRSANEALARMKEVG